MHRTRPLVWRTEADVADIRFERYSTSSGSNNTASNGNQTQAPGASGVTCRNSVQVHLMTCEH